MITGTAMLFRVSSNAHLAGAPHHLTSSLTGRCQTNQGSHSHSLIVILELVDKWSVRVVGIVLYCSISLCKSSRNCESYHSSAHLELCPQRGWSLRTKFHLGWHPEFLLHWNQHRAQNCWTDSQPSFANLTKAVTIAAGTLSSLSSMILMRKGFLGMEVVIPIG